MEVSIYIKTDFRGNPRGTGEAAALIEYVNRKEERHVRRRHIRIEHDTKNALVLKICNEAIRILLKPCNVTIYTDCEYMANAVNRGWLETWQKNGWKKARGKPLANAEEWIQFHMLTQIHTIRFECYDGQCEEELKEILESKGEEEKHEKRDRNRL